MFSLFSHLYDHIVLFPSLFLSRLLKCSTNCFLLFHINLIYHCLQATCGGLFSETGRGYVEIILPCQLIELETITYGKVTVPCICSSGRGNCGNQSEPADTASESCPVSFLVTLFHSYLDASFFFVSHYQCSSRQHLAMTFLLTPSFQ